jgi:type VI secretion system protein ImpA
MNAFTDIAVDADEQQVLDDVAAPLGPEAPCGTSARHDPVFTEIRLLREEDDPGLPMRQWERELKRADWAQIERRCIGMLTTRSKDLQIVAWLIESWTRQRGLPGLGRGLALLDSMLRRYWPLLHPVIEADGDCDARLAPLEWLNESLSVSVRVHVALLQLGGGKPQPVTLADWERVAAADDAAGARAPSGQEGELTRAGVLAAAAWPDTGIAATRAAAVDSGESLRRVIAFLGAQLGAHAPNLGKLQNVLESIQRVLMQWVPEERACAGTADPAAVDAGDEEGAAAAPLPAPEDKVAAQARLPAAIPEWRGREDAYAALESLADYLTRLEPHSPAPFLIRRAVKWSRMSLPEVLAEVVREEGDLNRLVNVLGIAL